MFMHVCVCVTTGEFYFAVKAFDMLSSYESLHEFWEAKRGACCGVLQVRVCVWVCVCLRYSHHLYFYTHSYTTLMQSYTHTYTPTYRW
jgi:hypothetical protein